MPWPCGPSPPWPATTTCWPPTSSTRASACFELGNIGSECHLTDEQLDLLVTSYYGRRLVNRLARARLQALMSQYGWTLWASIQQATSDIDFDFWTWGMEKYERAVRSFRHRGLDALIADVQRSD